MPAFLSSSCRSRGRGRSRPRIGVIPVRPNGQLFAVVDAAATHQHAAQPSCAEAQREAGQRHRVAARQLITSTFSATAAAPRHHSSPFSDCSSGSPTAASEQHSSEVVCARDSSWRGRHDRLQRREAQHQRHHQRPARRIRPAPKSMSIPAAPAGLLERDRDATRLSIMLVSRNRKWRPIAQHDLRPGGRVASKGSTTAVRVRRPCVDGQVHAAQESASTSR